MLKRLAAASDIATTLILVALGLSLKEAWRSGFDLMRVGALTALGPVAAAFVLVLCLALIPPLFESERLSWQQAVTMPAIHGALTLMVTKMIATQPHAVVAARDVFAPAEHWLNPMALAWLVGIELAVLGVLAWLRGLNQGKPVS